MFAGITPCPRLRVATSFGSTYEVAATWFSALVIIDLQLRPVPVAILAGKIPVAVCCRIDRINVSSRVAISTFAKATRSVSCAIDAESRNAATVTMIANPITEMYYYENMRLSEIAALFGVTESRICQIRGEAVGVLRKYLTKLLA
jgi:hypothetical protein